MPVVTGVVQRVHSKELPAPDQYDNTHRLSIQVGDEWYSVGSNKGGSYINKDVRNLEEGYDVEFMYQQNGDFRNVKKASFTINGTPRPQTTSSSPPSTASKPPARIDNSVGMAVGMAINNAVALACAGKIDEDDLSLEKKAVEIYYLAERLKKNAAAGCIDKDLQGTGIAPSDDFSDDDIPF
jgi:hypothetical protein